MNFTQPKQITVNMRMPNRKLQRIAKNTGMTLVWPVACAIIALILSSASGKKLFQSTTNFWVFMSTVMTTFIAMWALNTNLNSGRMDFSLGATGLLAALIASKVAKVLALSFNTPAGVVIFLLLTVVLGMILGLISGMVYIVTRLPAIVTSLGMCLVFEGIAAIMEGKTGQIKYRDSAMYAARFTSQPINIISILVVIIILMSLIICYSRFGYNKNALVFNQKIACETGINEISSCIFCYLLAGGLIALYEVLQDIASTNMNLNVDLATASTVFRNFLPIFIGSMMTKYSNQLVSSFFACIATTLLARGLDNAKAIGITSPIASLITSIMILGILTYMVDKQAFINWVKMRRYIQKQKRLGFEENKTEKENIQ